MSVHDRKNLKSALESAILYLQKQGVEEARQDAWLLLEHVCPFLIKEMPISEESFQDPYHQLKYRQSHFLLMS